MSFQEPMSRRAVGEIPGSPDAPGSFEVIVLHTSTNETLDALKIAARLAEGLAARIRLLVLERVPYPLDVNQPQAAKEFRERRFRTVADHARIETRVDIRLGRDYRAMLESALNPRSLIVVGGTRGRWPAFHHRLARRLERLGHHVVFSAAK